MSFLTSKPITKIDGFKLNMSFDVILEIYNLFDEELDDVAKIETALYMLVKNKYKLKRLNINQKNKLVKQIFDDCINPPKKPAKGNEIKTFDFSQDSEYIYSSFLAYYGIDLVQQQGKLHWKKFIALFQGLGDKTKIKEIIAIRSKPLPKPTKYNQEDIQNLRELKQFYALQSTEEDLQNELKQLFTTLERMAK